MNRKIHTLFPLIFLATLASGCFTKQGGETKGTRDARWAKPLIAEGLPNFHQITPGLYRGAQPESPQPISSMVGSTLRMALAKARVRLPAVSTS